MTTQIIRYYNTVLQSSLEIQCCLFTLVKAILLFVLPVPHPDNSCSPLYALYFPLVNALTNLHFSLL